MKKIGYFAFLGLLGAAVVAGDVSAAPANFTLAQVLDYPFISELDANEKGGHIAFVRDLHGVRNVGR